MIEIHKGIFAIGLSLYIKEYDVLVLSDLHIGYEESLSRKGTFIPRFQLRDTLQALKGIFKQVSPNTMVLNGDLKHEFGAINAQEWRELIKIFDFLKNKRIIIIKGNHDVILEPIANKRNIEAVRSYTLDDILILHGDELVKSDANILIIGHEHPALGISDPPRREIFKCFLKGKWNGKTIIIQPSFNPLIEGADVLKERQISPYLKDGVVDFEAWVVGKDVLYFGKIKNFSYSKQ